MPVVTGHPGGCRREAPNLTIQTADYLHAALRSYAEARRHSGFMQPQAATLTDAQMLALADCFSQTPRLAGGPADASAEELARGREIAVNDIPERGVASCLICHERGADEPDKGLFFPSLFGRSETFLRRQLDLLAAGSRGATGIFNPMHAEAHGVSQADRDAVAAWLAAQVPTKVAQVDPATVPVSSEIKERTVKVCATRHEADLAGRRDGNAQKLPLQTAPYFSKQTSQRPEGRDGARPDPCRDRKPFRRIRCHASLGAPERA
ncbi:MAG: hypothetical protein U1E69_00970 [Tabrizicola sp.]|uniref:c-type cytochrome n=1 Tax=Tabrizicola sp. TaxID=2005166 RepID=UPI002ABBA949|nr:hypothetical protein [Tabrizicola sp.]MDZ4085353.1 hypothetical protein [Tabrizicola sp.]